MEKESDIGSVTVRVGRRVGREFLGDRQRDEGVRPRHRAREGRRLDRSRGKVKAVRVQTKGADKVRGVRRVRGKSVVGQRLEWVRVGKARGLQRRWGQSWLSIIMHVGTGIPELTIGHRPIRRYQRYHRQATDIIHRMENDK